MNPFAAPREQRIPSGPRNSNASRRGGGGRYHKRKAWLEILPEAPPLPPARTHGNPFGFSNVPADRAVPLAFDHPLKEELAEVKRVRESRRSYWLQVAEKLPDDMNNPGSYDYQRWKNEENTAEAKIEELAGLIALAERGITVERAKSPPVAVPFRDSARGGSDDGAVYVRSEVAPFPPALRSARKSTPRESYRSTERTRRISRASSHRAAPGARNSRPREPITQRKGKNYENRAQRVARNERSKARRQKSQPLPAGSVIWTDDARTHAVTKWMREMGAAVGMDRTVPDDPLYIGSPGSDARSHGDEDMNLGKGDVANITQVTGQVSPTCSNMYGVWSPEDELHFEEAEAQREAERREIASFLNAESHPENHPESHPKSQSEIKTEKMVTVACDQVKEPLPASTINTEISETAKETTAEEKSNDLLAALLADLDSRSLSPSSEPQPPAKPPPTLETVQLPLPNPPSTLDRDQAVADAVWKAFQTRKAQKAAAAAAATAEVLTKDASDWVDINKVAPIEVMDLQDIPDVRSDPEDIVKKEDSEQIRCVDIAAPAPLLGRVLYAGNLSFEADEEQLRHAFRNFQVESVIIPHEPRQERPPGHAFIIMRSAAEAESAVADSFKLHVDNRLITVRLGSLPKQYLSNYTLPTRVAETSRGRDAVIRSPNGGSRHKSMLLTGARSSSRRQNGRPSSVQPFDKETVREVEEMMNNPNISCKSLTEVRRQQHKPYLTTQLKKIKMYCAIRDGGEELHFKKIRLINNEEDFESYLKDLMSFKG